MEKNNVLEFAGRERISDPLTALLRSGALSYSPIVGQISS